MIGELDRVGVVKLEGFLPISAINLCSTMTDELFRLVPLMPQIMQEDFANWGGMELERVANFISGLAFPELIDELTNRFRAVFGSDWTPNLHRSFFRRLASHANKVPWHIDIEAASTAAAGRRCVNLWVPMRRVGDLASPSMDFVLGSNHISARPATLDPNAQPCHRDDKSVAKTPGERWTPLVERGDALVFDEYTLHRTQRMERFSPRTTLELRFALPGERQR